MYYDVLHRSYHIMYQLIQPYGDGICEGGLREKCRLSTDIYDYVYVSQGKTKVDSIDDNEELEYTEDAFNVLGFAAQVMYFIGANFWDFKSFIKQTLLQEKFECYMLTAAVMTYGGVEFKTKGRDDQAECELIGPETYPGKAAAACGVDPMALIKAFCKPRIKASKYFIC